jgi:cytochrome d ubiquinol oxidase subunit II
MTGVALVFVPIVIAYQAWNYRVFRKKIDPNEMEQGKAY